MGRESLKTLPVGTRVYYTGDMANRPATGTIVEHKADARFSDELRIKWDAEEKQPWEDDDFQKPDSWICPVHFEASIGRRFYRLADWNELQRKRIADMQARYAKVLSR